MKTQKITPFLWFDSHAEAAMNFYTSVFTNSKINEIRKWPENSPFPAESTKPGTVQAASFTLEDLTLNAFDAGPMFSFNSSISFFIACQDDTELEKIWNQLIAGGEAMMPLGSYPWSKRYGWLQDQFGIAWQIMLHDDNRQWQKLSPLLFFTGKQQGRAEEAIRFYQSIFPDSGIDSISRYEAQESGPTGMVKHAQFQLAGQKFRAMDSGIDMDIPFTEAISLFVNCKNQEEIDHYWSKLSEGGSESVCGWLKDPFGVSWQIVPASFATMLSEGNPERIQKVMAAVSQMTKLNIAELEAAYHL